MVNEVKTNNSAQTIRMDIPRNGTLHKYIIGKDQTGQQVIIAKPICQYRNHVDIRNDFENTQGKLADVRGGYAKFVDGVFLFSGSSRAYGHADHRQVSRAVNGSDLRTTLKIGKVKLEEKLRDEFQDLKYGELNEQIAETALWTTMIGSFATAIGIAAYKGFMGESMIDSNPLNIAHGAIIGANATTQAAGEFRNYDRNNPLGTFAGVALGHAAYAGLAYLAGSFVRAVMDKNM
ncbi:hypothetical protein KA107_02470 [Candidatus Pacearchaeota archaeon]|nr:hypothetical protein [Candidatus Pacearchaeota archaeon]